MIPRRYETVNLAMLERSDAVLAVQAWLVGGNWANGDNLILSGPVGTGKTTLAVAALNWFRGNRPRATIRFSVVPELLENLRPPADINRLADDLQTHILVLDDLGAERPSDWVRERLYVLVNRRYLDCLPTIVTTNSTLPDLGDKIGERLVSRLRENATIVAVTGKDRR